MIKVWPEGRAWTTTPSRRWFARCDRCDRRRLVADYYECYGKQGDGWWWECARCLINTVTTYAESVTPKKRTASKKRSRP